LAIFGSRRAFNSPQAMASLPRPRGYRSRHGVDPNFRVYSSRQSRVRRDGYQSGVSRGQQGQHERLMTRPVTPLMARVRVCRRGFLARGFPAAAAKQVGEHGGNANGGGSLVVNSAVTCAELPRQNPSRHRATGTPRRARLPSVFQSSIRRSV